MCLSPQTQKFQKDFLKLYNDKNIKQNLSKAQIYLISNKELLSRNYEKFKSMKKNSFQKDKNNNNNIGIILQINKNLLSKSYLNNSKNKNRSIKNCNSKEKEFISSYSFHDNELSPKNNFTKFKKNPIFNSEHIFNQNLSKIKSQDNIKVNINKKKINYSNSMLNIKNITKDKNGINKFCVNLNKIINKNNQRNTKNNLNRNFKKIVKYPLSPNFSKIKSINLSLTTRQKTPNFSRSLSINSSSSNANNITKNLSDKIEINKYIEKYYNNKKYKNNNKNKIDKKKINEKVLFNNKLKKTFFNYINKNISKSKERKNDSLSLFEQLYKKLSLKSFNQINPLIFKIKSKRSASYSNLNIPIRYDNNKNIKSLINSNDVATSGSANLSFQEENISEEIHFKAVKYYQEIKKENQCYD